MKAGGFGVLQFLPRRSLSTPPPSFDPGVSRDLEFVEGLVPSPSEAAPCGSLPQDQVKTPRTRGRPRKAEKAGGKKNSLVESSSGLMVAGGEDVDVDPTGRELMVLTMELLEPYGVLTRARSVVLMGKRLSTVYNCTYDVASHQIASQIFARRS